MIVNQASFIFLILGFVVCVFLIWVAGKRVPTLRSFAAIEAIPEVVGRAVEMGKPALMSPGAYGAELNRPGPVAASLPLMHHVARHCARLGCRLITAVAYADTYAATLPAIESAYAAEGKRELFNVDDIIYFGSLEGYLARYAGLIASEDVAAQFLTGSIASAGNYGIEMAARAGAMTCCLGPASGSAVVFQALCADYLLIGEEFYAASAQISGDTTQLGSLAGTDVIKIGFLVVMVIGIVLTAAAPTLAAELTRLLRL